MTRKPFQGVLNIVRFNWHVFVIVFVVVLALLATASVVGGLLFWTCISIASVLIFTTLVSLLISYYIYDCSPLYSFSWIREIGSTTAQVVANINAGFDETSGIVRQYFPTADFHVFDFYDPSQHTEVSIKRARRMYPPYPGTCVVSTNALPLVDSSVDIIFNIFALHEVRSTSERIEFLKAQANALGLSGRIIVVEHLRNLPNFIAYTVGFLHFFSLKEWKTNFAFAQLQIRNQFSITPFVTVFVLQKVYGSSC